MFNLTLEDEMLNSAYENFLKLTQSLEKKITSQDSVYKVSNDIELLKDIFQEASMHLECFICHEKLLLQDQSTLINKQHVLVEEFNQYKENSKKVLRKTNQTELKQAKKDNAYLKTQIKKYLDMIKETKTEEDKLMKKLQQTCKKAKDKDFEASKLLNDIEKTSLVLNENKSMLKSPSDHNISKTSAHKNPSNFLSKIPVKNQAPENDKIFGNKLT